MMTTLHFSLRHCTSKLFQRLLFLGSLLKLHFYSLFYNKFADKYYVGDTSMEPMFWIVDHFTKILGPICVAGVIILIASMVAIAYVIGLPFYLKQSKFLTVILLIIGNWILINILFHYYMAYTTQPGQPPQGALVPEAVSICKKCIAPKPPRTHHCSICNVCILKMDHHCPWLNNCVGHYNHRFFFMFCVYIWIGVLFAIIFGIPIAYQHFIVGVEPQNSTYMYTHQDYMDIHRDEELEKLEQVISNDVERKRTWPEALYHSCIVYAALLCISTFIAVGALTVWHSRLISRGETSIESHINKKEKQRLEAEGKIFQNPYDFGRHNNWLLFLGILNDGRSWFHILFPSNHEPEGNGLQWHTRNDAFWTTSNRVKWKLKD